MQSREKALEFQRALQSIDKQEKEEFVRIEALIKQRQVQICFLPKPRALDVHVCM